MNPVIPARARSRWIRRTFALAACGLLPLCASAEIVAQHPRLILDQPTLTALRARARANTPEWQALKDYCDGVLPGKIAPASTDSWGSVPNIGSNYQGAGYLEATMNLGLCYQVMKGINADKAAPYGDKLAAVLKVISEPSLRTAGRIGDGAPCVDSGYGVRNFGIAFGYGFDWGNDRLSPALRQQVIAAGNAWINAVETSCDYSVRAFPSNYHAGYFHAKAVIALATHGDNPEADAMWKSWLADFRGKVLPYYNRYFAGGGWLEGYANYAPSTLLHMALPAREVKTATGIDLVTPEDGSVGYAFPVDSAIYPLHFSWPSRRYFDDRDTNRSNGNPATPPGLNNTGMYMHLLGTLDYYGSPLAPLMRQYLDEVRSATSNFSPPQPWQAFLFFNPTLKPVPIASLPLSYHARGIGAVAMRSSWSKDATWMSFRAAPYIASPEHAEEYQDQGSLALVRGDAPFVVNASGWIVHEPGGTCDEGRIYEAQNGTFGSEYHDGKYAGNAAIFNIFYVRKMKDGVVQSQFGQMRVAPTAKAAPRTAITAFEDAGAWAYTRASHLEDLYRKFGNDVAVGAWSREILYLRPNRFVVLDRTRKGQGSFDQYMAFAFPAAPESLPAAAGQNRIAITFKRSFMGAMTSVYPTNAKIASGPVFPPDYKSRGDDCDNAPMTVKAWQSQIRPADAALEQRWLTVFDLAPNAASLAATTALDVTAGEVLGVVLSGGNSNQVVISGNGAQGSAITGEFSYTVPVQFARHIAIGVEPGSTWSISANRRGETLAVTVTPGGDLKASEAGVLEFVLDAAAEVRSGATLFFTGFDH